MAEYVSLIEDTVQFLNLVTEEKAVIWSEVINSRVGNQKRNTVNMNSVC